MVEITGTITGIEYEDVHQMETVTPLGIKQTVPLILDNVRLALDVGELVGHAHVCKPEAIGNRLVLYGLEAERDALDALVREVVFSWSGLEPETDDRAGELGGVDSRIAIEWTSDAEQELERLLAVAAIAERIAAAVELFARKLVQAPVSAPESDGDGLPDALRG